MFVTLDELPLNKNGKTDLKRLPRPGNERPDLVAEHLSARTWVEVIAKISRDLGFEVTVRALFDNPTVAELAALIGSSLPDETPRA